jgi:23S rRNA pseudouridine2605 synthase
MDTKGERIAKRIARAGLCSRRDAERWIEEGRVRVNGQILRTPACVVTEDDEIVVDGEVLPGAEKTRLFLYHKPAGLVTTAKDEKDRPTVFSKLPPGLPRVISIGRLDMNTEGLLLLTNDGGLSRYLELPDTGWRRRYRVRVHGKVDEKRLDKLKDGITIEGIRYKSIEAKLDKSPEGRESAGGTNSWLTIVLREGKNREIRKVMEALGLKVNRLIRTDYGPFTLGDLTPGSVEEVRPQVLKDQVAGYFKDPKKSPKK